MNDKRRYGWTLAIYDKRLKKWEIRHYTLNWVGLQFDARRVRCRDLCIHWLPSFVCSIGKECHKGKCTVDGRPYDVCALFMSSSLLPDSLEPAE